jgi:hypothetical protein
MYVLLPVCRSEPQRVRERETQRERQRERQRETERKIERERENVVHVLQLEDF